MTFSQVRVDVLNDVFRHLLFEVHKLSKFKVRDLLGIIFRKFNPQSKYLFLFQDYLNVDLLDVLIVFEEFLLVYGYLHKLLYDLNLIADNLLLSLGLLLDYYFHIFEIWIRAGNFLGLLVLSHDVQLGLLEF